MKTLLITAVCLSLSACASIVTGTTQSVSIETSPKAARCDLQNDKGKWHVSDTPASVVVQRSYNDLNVTCHKAGMSGSSSFKSTTKAMAMGNIVFGGAIGAGVDAATGAAFDYPSVMKVELK